MSVKIWTAYKLKDPTKLWELVHDIRLKGQTNVTKALAVLYAAKAFSIDPKSPEYQEKYKSLTKYLGDSDSRDIDVRYSLADHHFCRAYKEQYSSHLRNEADFTVSVSLRHFEGNIYLIPHCDMFMRDALNFLKRDKRLVDYHYQNQVRPHDAKVSDAAYERRGKIYEKMEKAGVWNDYLVIEVCAPHNFYLLRPKQKDVEKILNACPPKIKRKKKPGIRTVEKVS